MCVCVLVLIRSWISKFHRWNPLFYSISVFKMIHVASCNSDRVAWLCTASALVTAAEGTREQSDALLSNHAGELGEILIWLMTQLNMSAGVWLVSLQGLAITFLGPSCLCLSMEWCTEPLTGAAQRTAGCAWGSPLPPPRARSCQAITLMMHLHVSSLGAHLGWASLHCVRQASTVVWSRLDLGSVISKKPVSSPPQNTRHRRKGTWFLEELIVQGVPTVF